MLYLLILLYIVWCIYWFDYKRQRPRKHYWVLCFLFILVSGLSYRLGCDVIRYQYHFENEYTGSFDLLSFFNNDNLGRSVSEPLWQMMNWLFYNIFGKWWIFKTAIAALVNITIFSFFKRHSEAPFTSVLLYSFIIFFEINYQVMRESIAISLFLIGLNYISGENKNYKIYYIFILLAFGFHRFAFLGVLYPILMRIKYDGRVLAITLATVVSIPFLMDFINSFLNLGILNVALGERVQNLSSDSIYGQNTRNIFGIIEMLILYIVPLMFVLKNNKSTPFLSLAIIYVILMVFKMTTFTILYRINNYLFFPFAIALASSINYSIYRRDFNYQTFGFMKSVGLSIFCVILYIGSSVRSIIISPDFIMYYPYVSVIAPEEVREREYFYQSMLVVW